MFAVLVGLNDHESYAPPDVYVFNDKDQAVEFIDYLRDTDPTNDGTEEFAESFDAVAVEVSIPPQHWDQAL